MLLFDDFDISSNNDLVSHNCDVSCPFEKKCKMCFPPVTGLVWPQVVSASAFITSSDAVALINSLPTMQCSREASVPRAARFDGAQRDSHTLWQECLWGKDRRTRLNVSHRERHSTELGSLNSLKIRTDQDCSLIIIISLQSHSHE